MSSDQRVLLKRMAMPSAIGGLMGDPNRSMPIDSARCRKGGTEPRPGVTGALERRGWPLTWIKLTSRERHMENTGEREEGMDRIEPAHHAFRVQSAIASGEAVKSPVVASWRRSSLLHRLDPAEGTLPQRLTGSELRRARERGCAARSRVAGGHGPPVAGGWHGRLLRAPR